MPCPSQFTICYENWADMTPTQRGRLCARCDRELIDFTDMSEAQIRAYHLRNPGTCGLYSLAQFQRSPSRLAAAAAAAAIGLAMPAVAHADMQAPMPGMAQSEPAPIDTIDVRGTVIDSGSKQPIAGAQVVIIGSRLGAITDYNGQFRFVVRSSVTFPLHLQAQYIGYTTQKTTVTSADSLGTLKFELSQMAIGIVGIEIVGETRPLVPLRRPSFWQRIWRVLGGH